MEEASERVEDVLKILLIGNCGVGKTSLVKKYVDDIFVEEGSSTIGLDYVCKEIEVEGQQYQFQIWDTTGQERFKTITSSYYHGADGIIITFDLTNSMSFGDVHQWNREVERFGSDNVVKLLIGNKNDLATERKVENNVAQSLATSLKLQYFEASAKSSDNVAECFETLANLVIKRRFKNNEPEEVPAPVRIQLPPPKQRRCAI